MKTRIVRSQDIAKLVSRVGLDELMDRMIQRLDEACTEFDAARIDVRPRDGFNYTVPHTGLVEWMPVFKRGRYVTIKIVGYHPANPRRHALPTILSTIGCYDAETGHIIGLVDGTFLTALRTAAASAVASRVLARRDAEVFGIIGAGAQAITQLHAMLRSFPVKRVLISDTDTQAVASFAARAAAISPEHLEVREAPLDLLVQSSDILCTATSIPAGAGPLFQDIDHKPWLHVNAVGADFPGKTELPVTLLKRALVCPDFCEQAAREGECQQLEPSEVGPDLVGLCQNVRQYAAHRDSLTVFDSTGYALEDQVAMEMLLEYGERFELGFDVQLESVGGDPLDPYDFGLRGAASAAAARLR